MNFREKYKYYSNARLLKIIQESDRYQDAAVKAAHEVMNDRQLSDHDVKEAEDEIERDRIVKETRARQNAEQVQKIAKPVSQFLKNINPIDKEGSLTTNRIINVFSIAVAILCISQLISRLDYFLFLVNEEDAPVGSYELFYFGETFYLAVAGLLFYIKRAVGWYMLAIYGIIVIIFFLSSFGLFLYIELTSTDDFRLEFLGISSANYLMTAILYGGALFTICIKSIRNVYSITKPRLTILFSLVSLATLAALWFMYGGMSSFD